MHDKQFCTVEENKKLHEKMNLFFLFSISFTKWLLIPNEDQIYNVDFQNVCLKH